MIELPPPLWLPPRPAIIRPADRELLKLARRDAIKASRREASFMPGMFPAGAVSSRPLPALSFIGFTENTADLTTYTFTAVAIGAEHSTRRVVVVLHWGELTTARTLVSATIAGIAATVHLNVAASNSNACAIISALVPAGTTANIVFTLSAAADRGGIAVYRAINETVATPHATASDTTISAGQVSATISIPEKGWVIGASATSGMASATADTWAGVTEQYGLGWGDAVAAYRTGAFQSGLPLQAGRTISCTYTAGTLPATATLAAMSWG